MGLSSTKLAGDWCESPGCWLQIIDHRQDECAELPKLSRAQKRDLLAAYQSPEGVAFNVAYGPMVALTQTYRLAHEIFVPFTRGFTIEINRRGRAVAEMLGRPKDG